MLPRLVAEKLAWQATRQIGLRWGESFPFYYVCEHPKSGGTWLAGMIANYLRLPNPRQAAWPPTSSCVIQNHWHYDRRLRRVTYLYRDGRDVMVSYYFHRIHTARYSQRPGRERVRRIYEGLLGKNYDPGDIVRHLPRFIEFEFAQPGRGSDLNWSQHIDDWYPASGGRPGVTYVNYESLHRDPVGTMTRTLASLTGEEPEHDRLSAAVEKMSMQNQTGRSPGEEDVSHFIRKATVGEWRDHFSKESAELFDQLAGHALIRLGYEEDPSWVSHYEYVTS